MSEKRRPTFKMLLKKPGNNGGFKSFKIEIFPAILWPKARTFRQSKESRFRIRINGKWFGNKRYTFLTKYEIRDALWRTIVQNQLFD